MAGDHKKTLESRLWDIANALRGKMGADEFRDYILGSIFYKYLSERMHLFADEILKNDGITFDSVDEDRLGRLERVFVSLTSIQKTESVKG